MSTVPHVCRGCGKCSAKKEVDELIKNCVNPKYIENLKKWKEMVENMKSRTIAEDDQNT